jgi:hypothetical protein
MSPPHDIRLEPGTRDFYQHAILTLTRARIPFLVGGAYAFQCYTGITRYTKDLDLFVPPGLVAEALVTLRRAGFPGKVVFPHWLAKAWSGDHFIDLIFSSGNGIAAVDDGWFEHAVSGSLAGLPVQLCPVEEMIWSKAFIMERERFDGGDVAHLLLARGVDLDWYRLLDRFAEHWRVLCSHLVLFGYIYPGERHRIPPVVLGELLSRFRAETVSRTPDRRLCRGPILSRAQYLVDTESWNFADARLKPEGPMTSREIDLWTRGIEVDGPGWRPRATEESCGRPPHRNGPERRPST